MSDSNSNSVISQLEGLQAAATPGARLRELRRGAGLSVEELGKRAAQVLGRPRPLSAGAVRNQENGTNGIPPEVAEAYGKVLGTTPAFILFGIARQLSSTRGALLIGEVGQEWRKYNLDNIAVTVNDAVIACNLLGYERLNLIVAFRVADNSLAPEYKRDDIVFAAQKSEVGIKLGDHVVATRRNDADHGSACVRRIASDGEGVFLADVNTSRALELLTLPDGSFSEVGVPWVVIGSMRIRAQAPGPLLKI